MGSNMGIDGRRGVSDDLRALFVDLFGPRTRLPEMTPAGMASLLLGVSLTMMLCGWLTFFIGFMLMPWVLGSLALLRLAAVVSHLSWVGKSFFSAVDGAPRARPSNGNFSDKLLPKFPIL